MPVNAAVTLNFRDFFTLAPEVVLAVFAETPDLVNHFRPMIRDYMPSNRPSVNGKETRLDIVPVVVT